MHVHVSLGQDTEGKDIQYSLRHLNRILKQVVYYDAPLTLLMPPDRKQNTWARSNVKQVADWEKLHNDVPNGSWALFFNRFDMAQTDTKLLEDLVGERSLSWNFMNIPQKCGTVEFRRPPGVNNKKDAIKWVAFALGYIAHALKVQNWRKVHNTTTYPSTHDLRTAIAEGLRVLGIDPRQTVGLMPDDLREAIIPSADQLVRIEKSKKLKQNKPSPYIRKVEFDARHSFYHEEF
jgi:hypothetical protein